MGPCDSFFNKNFYICGLFASTYQFGVNLVLKHNALYAKFGMSLGNFTQRAKN